MQSSISGIKAAHTRTSVRAHNVANVNTPKFSGRRVTQAEAPSGKGARVVSIDRTNEETVDDVVALKTAKHAQAANVRVIRKVDEMMGTIIDLKK